MKKSLFGIAYVSVWVIIWGTVGSLIDLPFLNAEIYSAGSIGQISTFVITAFISLAFGTWLYPKISRITLLTKLLGLDADKI